MNAPVNECGLAVTPEELAIVGAILLQYVPDREAWAFGSRVKGAAKKFSDLDLVILGKQPLSLATLADLADAFTESDLPYKVDLVDWAATSQRFRLIIEQAHIKLQPSQAHSAVRLANAP